MKIQVTNLITGEKQLFVNDLSLTDNIISCILCNDRRTGELLNYNTRDNIKTAHPIKESVSTITGRQFACCETKDLHAKYMS